jgi:hypothetical protein
MPHNKLFSGIKKKLSFILKTFVFCTKCEFIYKINEQEYLFFLKLSICVFIYYFVCLLWRNIKIFHRNLCVLKYIILMFILMVMVFNDISVIWWRSVLLVEETRENHRPDATHWQTLSHNVVSSTPRMGGNRTRNVRGGGHWFHSYKSNYHTITTIRAPFNFYKLTNIRPLQLLILCFFVAVWESGREKKTGMGKLVRRSNFNYIVLLFSLFSQYHGHLCHHLTSATPLK